MSLRHELFCKAARKPLSFLLVWGFPRENRVQNVPFVGWGPKSLMMRTERPKRTDTTTSIVLDALFTGVSLKKVEEFFPRESLTKGLLFENTNLPSAGRFGRSSDPLLTPAAGLHPKRIRQPARGFSQGLAGSAPG